MDIGVLGVAGVPVRLRVETVNVPVSDIVITHRPVPVGWTAKVKTLNSKIVQELFAQVCFSVSLIEWKKMFSVTASVAWYCGNITLTPLKGFKQNWLLQKMFFLFLLRGVEGVRVE